MQALLQLRDATVAHQTKLHSQTANVVDFDAAALADKNANRCRQPRNAVSLREEVVEGAALFRGVFKSNGLSDERTDAGDLDGMMVIFDAVEALFEAEAKAVGEQIVAHLGVVAVMIVLHCNFAGS